VCWPVLSWLGHSTIACKEGLLRHEHVTMLEVEHLKLLQQAQQK
jgi:hypothetical protein